MRSFIWVDINTSKPTCLYLDIILKHYFPKVLVVEMYINNQQPVAKINKQINYNEYTSKYSSDFFFFSLLFKLYVKFSLWTKLSR